MTLTQLDRLYHALIGLCIGMAIAYFIIKYGKIGFACEVCPGVAGKVCQ